MSIRRLPNGIRNGWLTSPGPIAGTLVQVNLSSLDGLIEGPFRPLKMNDVDMMAYDPLKEKSIYLGIIPFILEKFSFKKTAKLDEKELNKRLEGLIGSATAKSNRHSLLWGCSVPEEQISDSVKLLADIAQGPGELKDEDIEEIYSMLKYESWEMRQELHFEDLLKDLIHRAAFDPSRTILSLSSPIVLLGREEDDLRKDEVLKIIKKAAETIKSYWQEIVLKRAEEHFCVVGGGAEEASEVKFIKESLKTFGVFENESSSSDIPNDSAYSGGILNWQTDAHPLCNISMALKCPSAKDLKSHVPLAILQMLLGGGGSFSAGGPGKGMYSRLYTQMLNRYSWLEHARVFSQDYTSDRIGGLFGINASCLPNRAPTLIKLMSNYLSTNLTASLTTIELSRAKNQLKSAVLMGLESRNLALESFAQQLINDTFIPPKELCRMIDETGEEDLMRVAKELSGGSNLSVVAYGQISSVPSYSEIQSIFNENLKKN